MIRGDKLFNHLSGGPSMFSRRYTLKAISALVPAFYIPTVSAQDAKILRIVIPFAAGGSSDGMARLLASRLSVELRRTVTVEPTPGGSGILAARRLLNSPADGTTLLNISPTLTIILPKTTKLDFDPLTDFVPVSNMGSNPLLLGVHKSVPATNLREFIAYVKSKPENSINFASGGAGTSTHLVAELFFKRAGLKLTHVPYKGGAPALMDLIAGNVQAYFGNPSDFLAQLSRSDIRVLGTSGEKRLPDLPDIPTLSETIPGLSLVTWNGLAFRKGTPKEDIDRVSQAIQRVSRQPEYIVAMNKMGIAPIGDSPEQFDATIHRDKALWNEAIEIANIKLE